MPKNTEMLRVFVSIVLAVGAAVFFLNECSAESTRTPNGECYDTGGCGGGTGLERTGTAEPGTAGPSMVAE